MIDYLRITVRGYIGVEGHQLHYRTAGDHGPALVLFHESPLSSRIFEPALPFLGTALRVWAFDTPGYGMSDPPAQKMEIAEYAAALLAGIDGLDIGLFAVGGTHTGAELAIEIAAQSQRVTHVVLSGVPLLDSVERASFLSSWSPDLELDAEGRYLRWTWDRYVRLWGADAPLELLNEGVAATIANYRHYNAAYNAAFRYDPEPALRKLACPILLLNTASDRFAFADDRVLHVQPGAKLIQITDVPGHLPWRLPSEYANYVIKFIGEGRA